MDKFRLNWTDLMTSKSKLRPLRDSKKNMMNSNKYFKLPISN